MTDIKDKTDTYIPQYHVELVRDRNLPYAVGYDRFGVTPIAMQILHQLLDRSPSEEFVVLHVAGEDIIGAERIAIGSGDRVSVSMPEVFRGAILARATNIIIAHNHAINNPTPSDADINVTDIVHRAGLLLAIPLLDHIIVSPGGRDYSMMAHAKDLSKRINDLYLKEELEKTVWDMKKKMQVPGVYDDGVYPPMDKIDMIDYLLGGKAF